MLLRVSVRLTTLVLALAQRLIEISLDSRPTPGPPILNTRPLDAVASTGPHLKKQGSELGAAARGAPTLLLARNVSARPAVPRERLGRCCRPTTLALPKSAAGSTRNRSKANPFAGQRLPFSSWRPRPVNRLILRETKSVVHCALPAEYEPYDLLSART